MEALKTLPCKPTRNDPIVMVAGPIKNLKNSPNIMTPVPPAIIFCCIATNTPAFMDHQIYIYFMI